MHAYKNDTHVYYSLFKPWPTKMNYYWASELRTSKSMLFRCSLIRSPQHWTILAMDRWILFVYGTRCCWRWHLLGRSRLLLIHHRQAETSVSGWLSKFKCYVEVLQTKTNGIFGNRIYLHFFFNFDFFSVFANYKKMSFLRQKSLEYSKPLNDLNKHGRIPVKVRSQRIRINADNCKYSQAHKSVQPKFYWCL